VDLGERIAALKARGDKFRGGWKASPYADEIWGLIDRADRYGLPDVPDGVFDPPVHVFPERRFPEPGAFEDGSTLPDVVLPAVSVVRSRVQRIRHYRGRSRVQDDHELWLGGERIVGVWGTRREVMRQAHCAVAMGLGPDSVPPHRRTVGVVPHPLSGRALARALRAVRKERRRPRTRRERKAAKMAVRRVALAIGARRDLDRRER
jgi:hypothetical protein